VLFDTFGVATPFSAAAFELFELLLHLHLEGSQSVSFELAWIKLPCDAEVVTRIICTFDTEDHKHVDLDRFGNVVVAEMDRLQSLALG